MATTPAIDPQPFADYLEAAQASARALGWQGIGFTRHLDGAWVAIALKQVGYGAALPMAGGPTREEAAASLLRTLRHRD